jgi:hypothetical protein
MPKLRVRLKTINADLRQPMHLNLAEYQSYFYDTGMGIALVHSTKPLMSLTPRRLRRMYSEAYAYKGRVLADCVEL